MNGQAAKRIRIVARIMTPRDEGKQKELVAQLKRSYKEVPYHKRDTPEVVSHSVVLRRHHGHV